MAQWWAHPLSIFTKSITSVDYQVKCIRKQCELLYPSGVLNLMLLVTSCYSHWSVNPDDLNALSICWVDLMWTLPSSYTFCAQKLVQSSKVTFLHQRQEDIIVYNNRYLCNFFRSWGKIIKWIQLHQDVFTYLLSMLFS